MSFKYPYPQEVDKKLFESNLVNLDIKYGLPRDVKFCSSCVISNQRPSTSVEYKNDGNQKKNTINFNANNICDACLVKEGKNLLDWEQREKEFREICDSY